jgi:hypothetical protein
MDVSEKDANVMPICRWRARLNRGATTPKNTAAATVTAGTPTITRRSSTPKDAAVVKVRD